MMTENKKRPWDIYKENSKKVSLTFAEERMNICKSCEHFTKNLGACNLCGCLMVEKTKNVETSCPINKWQSITIKYKEENTK
jgi:hypothetical protein